jgi:cysteine synthase A
VTVLCDSGDRYRSRLYDRDWLEGRGLRQPEQDAASIAAAPAEQQG